MIKKEIITIAGRPGSGKSSTAKAVAAALGFEHFSSGDLFRAISKENGIDVLQANLSAEANADIDRQVDGRLQEIYASQEQLVLDSRTAWHWMPGSFKVFLDLDLHTAAERILEDTDDARLASEHVQRDPDEYAALLQRRLESESRRYKALYGIDPYVMSNYDLVIDTAANNLEQVCQKVLAGYQQKMSQKS